MPEKPKLLFKPEDLPLIEKGLALFEDLYMVLYAAKRVSEKIKYPIKSAENFDALFDAKGIFSFQEWNISRKTFLRFVPQEFLPIETEEDFLTRMLIVLQMAKRTHEFDALQKPGERDVNEHKEVHFIPTPQPIPFYPNK